MWGKAVKMECARSKVWVSEHTFEGVNMLSLENEGGGVVIHTNAASWISLSDKDIAAMAKVRGIIQ